MEQLPFAISAPKPMDELRQSASSVRRDLESSLVAVEDDDCSIFTTTTCEANFDDRKSSHSGISSFQSGRVSHPYQSSPSSKSRQLEMAASTVNSGISPSSLDYSNISNSTAAPTATNADTANRGSSTGLLLGGFDLAHRVTNVVFSQLGLTASPQAQPRPSPLQTAQKQAGQLGSIETETIDFIREGNDVHAANDENTYVNVQEPSRRGPTDYENRPQFMMGANHETLSPFRIHTKDTLAILLSGPVSQASRGHSMAIDGKTVSATAVAEMTLVDLIERANACSREAVHAQRTMSDGRVRRPIPFAYRQHAEAARLFHGAATRILASPTQVLPSGTGLAFSSDGEYNREHEVKLLVFQPINAHLLPFLCANSPASLVQSLLLLSKTEARAALGLQSILRRHGELLEPEHDEVQVTHESLSQPCSSITPKPNVDERPSSTAERIRATVRGALNQPMAEDMSESVFVNALSSDADKGALSEAASQGVAKDGSKGTQNPVDEMMALERELREMDMTIDLSSSIASLDVRSHSRMKHSTIDGSFMVVPSESGLLMSSSMQGPQSTAPSSNSRTRTHVPRSVNTDILSSHTVLTRNRPNLVQNRLEASSARPAIQPLPTVVLPSSGENRRGTGLDASWWGGASVTSASQILTSSVISLASGIGPPPGEVGRRHAGQSAHELHQQHSTTQLIRLMDSLRTLGEENSSLLRQVEEAESAKREVQATREQMRRFQQEYAKRFASLKGALEKFRQGFPNSASLASAATGVANEANPVIGSEYARAAQAAEQQQRQEQTIRTLTSLLKKEKEDSRKKDAALRKYETFYREVKARSAQKAAVRQRESQQQGPESAPLAPTQENNVPPSHDVQRPAVPSPRRGPPSSVTYQRPPQLSNAPAKR
jgi:hypothetical protein